MLHLIQDEEEYALAVHEDKTGTVILMVWHRMPGKSSQPSTSKVMLESALTYAKKFQEADEQHDKVFLFSVFVEGAEISSDEALSYAAKILFEEANTIEAWATVTLDKGWRARILSRVTQMVAKMSDYNTPHRPFTSYNDAAGWLYSEWRVNPALLVTSVENMLDAVLNKRTFVASD